MTREDEGTAQVGMVVFLASWAMLFGSLFFAYGVLRLHYGTWPPPGAPELPRVLPALNTGVLLLSSVALERSVRRSERSWLAAALGLGVLFVGLQLGLWWRLQGDGLHWGHGTVAAVVYGLTGFHALHVLVGLGGLVAVFRTLDQLSWSLWTTYWHFVSVVWVCLFCSVFAV